ncbi:MAG TPA: hypoxanthine phosphoribosyltransferase [Pirellulales bacterium]
MKQILSAAEIEQGVNRLAAEVAGHYVDRPLTILGVLNGSVVLLADLIRRLDLPLRVGLVQASSYRGAATSPAELRVDLAMMPDIQGRHVLLIDDIFDTGHTLSNLMDQLREAKPTSVRSAVLLRKHGRKAVSMEPDHVVFEIPNQFVVGYGLDYQDAYRNLPYIAVLEDGDF